MEAIETQQLTGLMRHYLDTVTRMSRAGRQVEAKIRELREAGAEDGELAVAVQHAADNAARIAAAEMIMQQEIGARPQVH